MAESGFDFKKLIDDSKNSLTNPKDYFASMAKEGGFVEPIIKALIYGLIGGILNFIWSLLNLSSMQTAFGQTFGAGSGGIMIIVGSLIFALIGLFIGGVIMLIVSAICGGSTAYETNVRVTASLMVLNPINALLAIFAGINMYLGMIISLAVSLYGVYLLFNALVNTLEAKEGTAKIASIVLAAIPILMLIGAFTCQKATTNLTEMYKDEIEKVVDTNQENEEMQKKMQKMMNDAMKRMQKENK